MLFVWLRFYLFTQHKIWTAGFNKIENKTITFFWQNVTVHLECFTYGEIHDTAV